MQLFPHVPEELLRALEEAFPDRIPDQVPDVNKMGVMVGQQQVIRLLRHQLNIQLETQLDQGSRL